MRYRSLAIAGVLALVCALPALGQTQRASAKTKTSGIPRTPDGHPDFQGTWTNATMTPMQRPPERAGKLTVTDAEARVIEKKQAEQLQSLDGKADDPLLDAGGAGGTGFYNVLFMDGGSELARVDGVKRTSLIIDPPDGRMPPITREAKEQDAETIRNPLIPDTVRDRPLAERCLIGFDSTSGPPMMPTEYNNTYQIVQTPDYIMILVEMVHDVRIIRMNSQHRSSNLRQWLGDSVGHWEGETLMVDTTNFGDHNGLFEDRVGIPSRSARNLHVVERFKRVDANTILYRVTIDDPSTFSKSWTMEYPFVPSPGPVFEYACHEGNYSMTDMLAGARKMEQEK